MENISRRALIGGSAALGLVLLGGGGAAALAAPGRPAMVTHRNPNCGCCLNWVAEARRAGYEVRVAETSDIMAVKARLGVPDPLMSCHTTEVGGYVVEGHVPFEAVDKLLAAKPKGVIGIALPGMPAGSPGMDMGHGKRGPLEVMAFGRNGQATRFWVG